jgi:hypothetical protein
MKRSLLLLSCILITGSVFAQTETDSSAYMKGVAILNKAKTSSDFLKAANYFDTVTKDLPGQWLAPYYSGLAYVLAGQATPNKKQTDQFLDVAQKRVDVSWKLKPDEPEIGVLQAFLYQVRLMVDPQNRAISFSKKAETTLKKALASDSENPRAYFLMGNNIYYTPPVFKGGPKNALPLFIKAREKFQGFALELPFMPAWGKQQNEEMIKICKEAKN